MGQFSWPWYRSTFAFEFSLLRLFEFPSADDTIWVILLAKIAVEGCLHHPKRVWFVFGAVFFFSLQRRILSKSRPELEGWLLDLVVNISSCTPFSPYCQPCLRGSLCVFACSRRVYLRYFFAWHNWKTSGVGKGLFSSGTECCCCSSSDNSTCSVSVRGIHEGINDTVVTVGCVSSVSSVKVGNSNNKISSLLKKLWKYFKIHIGENISSRDII